MLRKRIALFFLAIIITFALVSCQNSYMLTINSLFEDAYVKAKSRTFDEEWMIGKTEQQIIEKYGEFDFAINQSMSYHDDCNTNYPDHFAQYVIHPYIPRNLGASYETRLVVKFNCDGLCIGTEVKELV